MDSHSAWLKERQSGIGGSDAAAVAGLNPWRSPLMVYFDKKGLLPPVEENEKMMWGKILEPVIAEEARKKLSKEFTNFELQYYSTPKITRHKDYDFLLASLDGRVYCEELGWGILEIKTTDGKNYKEWEGDKIPDVYMCQTQHYMMVDGVDYTLVAYLIGGNHFDTKFVKRDRELIDLLFQKEKEFWEEFYLKDIPPSPVGIDGEGEALKEIYNNPEKESSIDLPENILEKLDKYSQVKEQIKTLEEEKNQIEASLKLLLGNHEVGKVGDRQVKWTSFQTSRVDNKLLQAQFPEAYKACLTENTSRRFSIK